MVCCHAFLYGDLQAKNGVDEQQWLTDVLERIQSLKHKDLYQLLPNKWSKYGKHDVKVTCKSS